MRGQPLPAMKKLLAEARAKGMLVVFATVPTSKRADIMPGGRLIPSSSVGNIANAVLAGLSDGLFRSLAASAELLQDGMLDVLRSQ